MMMMMMMMAVMMMMIIIIIIITIIITIIIIAQLTTYSVCVINPGLTRTFFPTNSLLATFNSSH